MSFLPKIFFFPLKHKGPAVLHVRIISKPSFPTYSRDLFFFLIIAKKKAPERITNVYVSFPNTHKNDRYVFLQTPPKCRAQNMLVRVEAGEGLEKANIQFSLELLSQLVADPIFVPLKHGFIVSQLAIQTVLRQ